MRLWTRFLHAAGLVLIALTTALGTTEIALHSLRYRTPLYGRRNTHWSAAGNALAAEVITARLPDPP